MGARAIVDEVEAGGGCSGGKEKDLLNLRFPGSVGQAANKL